MEAFEIGADGTVRAALDSAETRVVARLVEQVAQLLGHEPHADGAAGAGASGEDGASGASGEEAILRSLDWNPDEKVETPRDPALARLLPAASHDDEDLAAEHRQLTESAVRERKIRHLLTVLGALEIPGGAVVAPGQEDAWLTALTDVRLVLASRLGIETDEDADDVYERARATSRGGPGEDPDLVFAGLYTALTWWQETLLDALNRRGGR